MASRRILQYLVQSFHFCRLFASPRIREIYPMNFLLGVCVGRDGDLNMCLSLRHNYALNWTRQLGIETIVDF